MLVESTEPKEATALVKEHKPVGVDMMMATKVLLREPYVLDALDELTTVCIDSVGSTGMGFTETDIIGLRELCFAEMKSVGVAPAISNITVSQKETAMILGEAEDMDWTVMDLESRLKEPFDEATTWTEMLAMTEETDLDQGSVEKVPAWTLVHLPQVQSCKKPQSQVPSRSLVQRLEFLLQALGTCWCFPMKATT